MTLLLCDVIHVMELISGTTIILHRWIICIDVTYYSRLKKGELTFESIYVLTERQPSLLSLSYTIKSIEVIPSFRVSTRN